MSEPARIGVIADDLTGGASIAGELVREGWPCRVLGVGRVIPTVGSVVIETGTRFADPTDAELIVAGVVDSLRSAAFGTTMKKVDSSLKGNAVAEIAAYIRSVDGRVMVSPACPTVETVVLDGVVRHNGTSGTDVMAALSGVTNERPELLSLSVVRDGPDPIAEWLRRNEGRLIVADAVTQADLDAVCAGAWRVGTRSFVGTYGMGAALARASGIEGTSSTPPSVAAPRVIVLVGSASERAQRQVEQMIAGGAIDVALDVHALLDGTGQEREAARVRAAVAASGGRDVVVHTSTSTTRHDIAIRRASRGLTERGLAQAFAGPMVAAIQAAPEAALVLVGGETTGAIAELLELAELAVLAELQPGAPLCRAENGRGELIVTKPGSFGGVDALACLSRALRS